MFEAYFGKYLENQGIITKEQYNEVVIASQSSRVKLGLLAVAEGFMTEEEAEEVNDAQHRLDKRFGDIAVSRGYLSESQVEMLLAKQGDSYLLFVQAMVERNILTLEEIQEHVKAYKTAQNLSDLDVDAIKSGDVDKIIPVLLRDCNISPVVKDYIALTARNIARFIDRQFRIEKVKVVDEISAPFAAVQVLDGDYKIFTGFFGEGEALKLIAEAYAKEEFEVIDIDVVDATCEFLNCNNGLFATKLSNEYVDIDMLPPILKDTPAKVTDVNNVVLVPIYIRDQHVDLVICRESKWHLE
ncbi:MAG: hypothetical protein E7271_04015 [Lachnospiraceae bacterium]|jgi:hypothetical protein|nr:hypothetical protein [Lachnospiraceae bacterium]